MPADNTNNFLRSKLEFDCFKNVYFLFANISVKPNSNAARSNATERRSRVMVTDGESSVSIMNDVVDCLFRIVSYIAVFLVMHTHTPLGAVVLQTLT